MKLHGRELVDGGVSSNTPIAAAIRLGARRLIVLPTGFACAQKREPQSVIGSTMHALSLMVARQLIVDLERWTPQVDIVVAPPLCPLEISAYDYSCGAELIERAAVSTRAWIAAGSLHTPGVPHTLKLHAHRPDGSAFAIP